MQAYPTDDKEIALFWGVPVRTVYRWKGDAAPLQDHEQMLSWLSTRKNLPRAVLEKIKLPASETNVPSPISGDAGSAQALKRLEGAELQAYERLQKALAGGNPLEVRECRESWLKISESLRRFDLLVEQSRRDAGELVPITVVGDFVRHFISDCATVCTLRSEDVTNEIVGKPEIEVYDRIRKLFDESIVRAIIDFLPGGKHSPDQRLIRYAADALSESFAQYKRTGLYREAQEAIDQAEAGAEKE